MGSRLFLQIPVKRRKNASRISRPCTMHTSMPNKRDLGVLSMRTIYKRRGRATRGRLEEKRAGPVAIGMRQTPWLGAEADAGGRPQPALAVTRSFTRVFFCRARTM